MLWFVGMTLIFVGDERGYVEVKGKGKLKTYLLRDGDSGAD